MTESFRWHKIFVKKCQENKEEFIMKKAVSIFLVLAMAVGCFAGCGSKEAKKDADNSISEVSDPLPVMQQFTEQQL